MSYFNGKLFFLFKIITVLDFFYPENSPLFKTGAHFSFSEIH